jgi:hypothetical protein
MPTNLSIREAAGAPRHDCAAEGGCRHLLTLATIEEIAGFVHAARSYAAAAAQCRNPSCCGTQRAPDGEGAVATPRPAIPLKLRREARASTGSAKSCDADLIHFDRSASIDIVSDREGNYVERRALKPETLPTRGDPLGYLYRYWRDLRAASACDFANIDTVHLERAGIIGRLHIVDVSSSDPADFHYKLFAYAVPVPRCNVPRAVSIGIWADSLLRDYNTARVLAVPQLHRMRCSLAGTKYHYTRLMLPFENTSGRVDRLAIAIRQEQGDGIKVDPGEQLGLAEVH